MKQIILLSIFSIVSYAKLFVYQPEELQTQFQDHYQNGFYKTNYTETGINNSIANFGHIPYGKKIMGPLVVADPVQACSELAEVNLTQIHDPIVLVQRGSPDENKMCTFVQKVKNAQQIGAKMVIIMDNWAETSYKITMADDGMGDLITIPSLFISEDDGEVIRKYAREHQDQQVSVSMNFDLNKVSHANYTFFLDLPYKMNFVMIREFNEVRKNLGQNVYLFFQCESCKGQNFTKNTEDYCISGGRYCALDPDDNGIATGKDIVLEQLRQVCIHQIYPEYWWDYMDRLDLKCAKPQSYKTCGEKVMKKVNIDPTAIQNCTDNSFNSTSAVKQELQSNVILDQQLELLRYAGILVWPSLSVNNKTYHGSLDAPDLMEIICASLETTPEGCYQYVGYPPAPEVRDENNEVVDPVKPNVTYIVILVIVILFLFFLFMIIVYKKMVKKEMNQEMNTTVNQMVSQYIAFYESKDKSTDRSQPSTAI